MSAAVVSQVTVKPHAADMYAIYLGKSRLGYVRLYMPGGPAPISWLPTHAGGVDLDTATRIALVERVRELMTAEWAKHEADLQRLRDLENGVATETAAPAEDDVPAE